MPSLSQFHRLTHTLACIFTITCLTVYTDLITAQISTHKSQNQSSIYSQFANEEEALSYQKDKEAQTRYIQHEDLVVTLSKSWWSASKFLILKSHEQGFDVSSTVRSMVAEITKNSEELLRLLDKKHDDVIIVSPAFQWAQSSTEIYLNIKYAYRWNSPGALSVENEYFDCNSTHFVFSAIGSHSGVKKKYVLTLDLFDSAQSKIDWNFASVGKVQVKLFKETPSIWPYLTRDTKKIPNMFFWWDMQEKLDKEKDEEERLKKMEDVASKTSNKTESNSPSNKSEKTEKKGVHTEKNDAHTEKNSVHTEKNAVHTEKNSVYTNENSKKEDGYTGDFAEDSHQTNSFFSPPPFIPLYNEL